MDNKVWLTDEQIEAIVSILTKQCDRIEDRNQNSNVEYPDLTMNYTILVGDTVILVRYMPDSQKRQKSRV